MYAVYVMHRTQIYLPDDDYQELLRLGGRSGQSMAGLVRVAVRRFLDEQSAAGQETALEASFGLWSEREEMESSLRDLRGGWSRREARRASLDR